MLAVLSFQLCDDLDCFLSSLAELCLYTRNVTRGKYRYHVFPFGHFLCGWIPLPEIMKNEDFFRKNGKGGKRP